MYVHHSKQNKISNEERENDFMKTMKQMTNEFQNTGSNVTYQRPTDSTILSVFDRYLYQAKRHSTFVQDLS